MTRKKHVAESPWASFSDALSGMLFVFVITTFWFALQLAEARSKMDEARLKADEEKERYTRKEEIEGHLVDPDRPESLTSCLVEATGSVQPVVQAEADEAEARVSLYLPEVALENVAWFDSNEDTFKDPIRAEAALAKVAMCIGRLLSRPELDDYRLRIYVEGHTDAVPVKGEGAKTNWELSGARAARVLRRVRELPSDHGSNAQRDTIKAAHDQGQLELIAVGWAELKPATARLCRQPENAIDDAVCRALRAQRPVLPVLEQHRAALDRTAFHSCVEADFGPLAGHSESELVRAWANRCLEPSPSGRETDHRLAMLRRVDLRIELLPRVSQ